MASRPKSGDEIPFDDDSLPPAVHHAPAHKTTITGSERAAFEKLYKKFNTRGEPKDDQHHTARLDQIADEYYEDELDNSSQSLDKVFDDVLHGEPRLRVSRGILQTPGPNRNKLGQEAQPSDTPAPASDMLRSRRKEAKAAAAKLRQSKLAERERIDNLLQDAQTDRELWQILNREVLDRVRKLDLDGTSLQQSESEAQAQAQAQARNDITAADSRIIFQNFPHHLTTAVSTLRTAFPSSPFPLSVLPAIKALGRSSYALGATTFLYRHLIRTAWIQQSSYTYIDSLLVDMNNGAIEFDADILALLDSIIKEYDMARSGRLGGEMQMVYGMEQFIEGIRKIRQWRSIVAEKLGVVTDDRRANVDIGER